MSSADTIFAPATGFGRAGIAVIRISGPRSRDVLSELTGGTVPEPRRASVRKLVDPVEGDVLDEALVLWLPGPASFTGEDQAELHIHGGVAIRGAVLRALSALPRCRLAEPGEFTRRAFLSGRMDLATVEGLADLIDAETEAQRRQALRQFGGALTRRVEQWRERLADALASVEACLDFGDEPEISDELISEAAAIYLAVLGEIERETERAERGVRLRDGVVVVIAGPPNAGKSTLLNAIAGREVAIVSPHAGTTRDSIEVHCSLDGLPVTFVDTAGLRDTADPVEQEGIARTRLRAENADLVLWLSAPGDESETAYAQDLGSAPVVTVATKSDLGAPVARFDLAISAETGDGVAALLDEVGRRAGRVLDGAGDAVATRERHRRAMVDAANALRRAGEVSGQGHEELLAEDLRLALRALGSITGRVDVEEILDRIFGQFCIGK